jgi:hypothetical protein
MRHTHAHSTTLPHCISHIHSHSTTLHMIHTHTHTHREREYHITTYDSHTHTHTQREYHITTYDSHTHTQYHNILTGVTQWKEPPQEPPHQNPPSTSLFHPPHHAASVPALREYTLGQISESSYTQEPAPPRALSQPAMRAGGESGGVREGSSPPRALSTDSAGSVEVRVAGMCVCDCVCVCGSEDGWYVYMCDCVCVCVCGSEDGWYVCVCDYVCSKHACCEGSVAGM